MKKLTIIFLVLFSSILFAQYGTSNFRKTGVLRGNQIRTIFMNTGVIAQPVNAGPQLAWKYDDNGYAGDLSIMIGLELPIQDYRKGTIPKDGIPDTIHSVIITSVERPGGGESGGYTFEPIPGYANPNLNEIGKGVAMSHLPETWPASWPDHPEYGTGVWNGLLAADNYVGTQEAFFAMDDFNDEENHLVNDFVPSTTDPTMRGHGIEVRVRYVVLDNPFYKDVLFRIYDIINKSTYNYNKLVLGNLAGTYIGIQGDEYNDDVSLFYPKDDLILSYDYYNSIRPTANPNWQGQVGMYGESFIHTPTTNKIASYEYFVPGGSISMSDDEAMWKKITPGTFKYSSSVSFTDSIPYAIRGDDGDYIWGGEYFSLDAGGTKRIVTVAVFGYNKDEILRKTKYAEALYHSDFDTTKVTNSISITSQTYHKIASGVETINWNFVNSNGTVEIWYSADRGNTWETIAKNAANTGTYSWNTSQFKDAAFAKLMICVKNVEGYIYGIDEGDYFTVNNATNGSPYVEIKNKELLEGSTLTNLGYSFDLFAGDPENDPLLLKVFYSNDLDTSFHYSQSFYITGDTANLSLNVDLNILPNTDRMRLKFEVNDGINSYSDISPVFAKQIPRQSLQPTNFEWISHFTEVPVEVRVLDAAQVKGEEYIISFSDLLSTEPKTFSVFNKTLNKYTLQNQPFYPKSESILFDGMVLYTEDITTVFDTATSRWNSPQSNDLRYIMDQVNTPTIKSYRYPYDYKIVFSDTYNDSSNYLINAIPPPNSPPPIKSNINFRVYRYSNNLWERIRFAFTETRPDKKDTLSYLDQIYLSDPMGSDLSWRIIFTGDANSKIPGGEDTLYLYTKKGISKFDSIKVFGIAKNVTEVFKNSDLNLQIPDNGEISDIINVNFGLKKTQEYSLSGIEFKIDTLLHTNVSDLVLLLSHNGLTDTLFSQVGGTGDNIIGCILSDASSGNIFDGSAPFSGYFKPQNPLSLFNGEDINGDWELRVSDLVAGNTGTLESWEMNFTFLVPTDVESDNNKQPVDYGLYQNYPNPFNPSSKISYSIAEYGRVSLKIYDILGREVTTLVNEEKSAGRYEVIFNASGLASGIYFYRLQAENYVETKKMILLK